MTVSCAMVTSFYSFPKTVLQNCTRGNLPAGRQSRRVEALKKRIG
jgi:hypothetical protein